jgi:hypothetical protein
MVRKDSTRHAAANGHQLAVRVPRALLDAIDAEVERLRAERPGSNVQRSDAVREILHQVLLADAGFAEESARRRTERREPPRADASTRRPRS